MVYPDRGAAVAIRLAAVLLLRRAPAQGGGGKEERGGRQEEPALRMGRNGRKACD